MNERIKNLRKSNNLSQENFAEKLGVSRQSVGNWENGKNYPSIFDVQNMCKIFNINADYIVLGKNIINTDNISVKELFNDYSQQSIEKIISLFSSYHNNVENFHIAQNIEFLISLLDYSVLLYSYNVLEKESIFSNIVFVLSKFNEDEIFNIRMQYLSVYNIMEENEKEKIDNMDKILEKYYTSEKYFNKFVFLRNWININNVKVNDIEKTKKENKQKLDSYKKQINIEKEIRENFKTKITTVNEPILICEFYDGSIVEYSSEKEIKNENNNTVIIKEISDNHIVLSSLLGKTKFTFEEFKKLLKIKELTLEKRLSLKLQNNEYIDYVSTNDIILFTIENSLETNGFIGVIKDIYNDKNQLSVSIYKEQKHYLTVIDIDTIKFCGLGI